MLRRLQYTSTSKRDLRIDFLRGLAMTCVIVNHSKLPSVLSWVTYERFWVVTAAEVFVALSGIVLGGVYGRRLVRDGWRAVAQGLGRRALLLYGAFIGVTLSVLALSHAGIDVRPIVIANDHGGDARAWLLASQPLTLDGLRDILLMRWGPWVFQIVGLYVWLVAAAAPCLLVLHFAGWRPLLAASWIVYLWYRGAPHPLTAAGFETTFPLLAWQLVFVHGIAIGYHRDKLAAFVAERRAMVPVLVGAAAVFALFALSNPWAEGPSWLHAAIVSPDRFTQLYFSFFSLTDLGVGRLLNLAVALPAGYAFLTWGWMLARPVRAIFVSLGQQSLGAFILHVYGVLALAHLPIDPDNLALNTVAQVLLIVAIAALLSGAPQRHIRRLFAAPAPQPMAA